MRPGSVGAILLPMVILAAPALASAAAPAVPAGDVALDAYVQTVGGSLRFNPATDQAFVVWSQHAWQAYPIATANLPGETVGNAVMTGGKLYLPETVLEAAMPPAPAPQAPSAPAAAGGAASAAFTRLAAVLQGVMGAPYLWGGVSPQGFDCSGLVQWVYARIGVLLPRTSFEQFAAGQPVTAPAPGDLVFFQTYAPGASHVGIYMGSNTFVDVGSTVVKDETITDPYWTSRYLGARRVL